MVIRWTGIQDEKPLDVKDSKERYPEETVWTYSAMFDALLLYQCRTMQPELYRNVEGVIETVVTLVVPLLCDESLQKQLAIVIERLP